jgi:hypothetical protein
MKNETIIKRVFKDFGENFEDLTGNQLLAIEECMFLARQDKANKVIKEIEKPIAIDSQNKGMFSF